MAGRAYLATLAVLLLAAGPCTALRSLHQADAGTAATPAGPRTAPSSQALALQQASDDTAAPAAAPAAAQIALSSQTETLQQQHAGAALQQASDGSGAPAASPAAALTAPSRAEAGVSYIQVNAPGRGDLLHAPAFAPAAAPLPAGVVSLAAGRSAQRAAAEREAQLAQDQATPESTSANGPATGEYSTIAAIDNTGRALPGGFQNTPLSASQLAAAQAKASKGAQPYAATAPTSSGAADGQQVVIHPTAMQKQTVDQVNAVAPTYQVSKSLSIKPKLATATGLASHQGNVGKQQRTGQATSSKQQSVSSTAGTAASTTPITVGGRTVNVFIPTIGDPEEATGDYLSGIVGVRIATPFFGTGFNFCIDRYFGSFPKVGIVIPNAAAWLLPEFQDVATALEQTLDLPSILPHGARVDPTTDGFLLWLPSMQPSQLPEFGIRYGIQIGQAFGYDFGIGIVKEICFVTFVIV
ncbi:hypothetical protein CVIRNUC_006899 [Coccomyxa viridis]|uniref:Uncharacterized protein n=1 Tax=Coccomyxa viridis TaxID=1274662 RepID=A0AAV1IB17_9CHLO|nr:hypothetical protein CVIRNUC_006899 [Coccomyxa viridis]